jgi:hypothetical protein
MVSPQARPANGKAENVLEVVGVDVCGMGGTLALHPFNFQQNLNNFHRQQKTRQSCLGRVW